ncbi:hypothetical protein [Mucilaginibacter agri]|uniref:Uncharacterized protein n=1 Tax=Mucilaginibacter agri TaxID=2695265 RepID=A0A966DQH2_9SPHI|nr:hypothetical protein [Mucilaginibacter agri]NCD68018.1 hypothetical protein [Mucilaginibacter agri]
MATEQEKLVQQLYVLKNKVQHSADRNEIISIIEQAIEIATPVAPLFVINDLTTDERKESRVALLKREIFCIKTGKYIDIETVKIQVSASLIMFMLVFVSGINSVDAIVGKNLTAQDL